MAEKKTSKQIIEHYYKLGKIVFQLKWVVTTALLMYLLQQEATVVTGHLPQKEITVAGLWPLASFQRKQKSKALIEGFASLLVVLWTS